MAILYNKNCPKIWQFGVLIYIKFYYIIYKESENYQG
nr:MAG TPA: hypothetical protein [Caudoviricetes sp.]